MFDTDKLRQEIAHTRAMVNGVLLHLDRIEGLLDEAEPRRVHRMDDPLDRLVAGWVGVWLMPDADGEVSRGDLLACFNFWRRGDSGAEVTAHRFVPALRRVLGDRASFYQRHDGARVLRGFRIVKPMEKAQHVG